MVIDCLKKIKTADYKFELIIVDDRSNPAISINKDDYDFDINLIRVDSVLENTSPKKSAVQMAVKSAKYDKIITIDDDTIVDEKYLDFISRIDADTHNYTVGLIKPYTNKQTFFSNIAMLDFIEVNLISLGCVKYGVPIYTNANNQLFSKKAFLEIDPYKDNIHILSGDDTFLLQKMSVNNKTINSFYNADFATSTDVPYTLKSFLLQRIRWISKQHKVEDYPSMIATLILYLGNVAFLLAVFFNPILFIKLLCIKTILEGILIFDTLKKFNLIGKLPYFILVELFQIVYIVFVPIIGILKGNKRW